MEFNHLVALDNHINHENFPLYNMTIDHKSLTPSMVSRVQTKNGSYYYTFALSPFLFFSFFFSKCEALDPSFCGHHLHHDHPLAPPLGLAYLI